MNMMDAIVYLEKQIHNPREGLPYEIFLFLTRNTPMVNVDLLVRDEAGRFLLSWRDDEFAGKGWHIPGGIIRFKETFNERISKVAQIELHTEVSFDEKPLCVKEIIVSGRSNRSHFISFLYSCTLLKPVEAEEIILGEYVGQLSWFKKSPDNLISYHEIYKDYLNA